MNTQNTQILAGYTKSEIKPHINEPEILSQMRETSAKHTKENQKVAQQMSEQINKWILLAKEIFGENSNEHKYCRKKRGDFLFLECILSTNLVEIFDQHVKEIKEELAKEKREQERKEIIARKLKAGMQYCFEHKLSTEGSMEACLHRAIEHLLPILQKKELEENGGYISFVGHNCNDWKDEEEEECPGWDGVSHRCECGNRRVYWDWDGESLEEIRVYACAD